HGDYHLCTGLYIASVPTGSTATIGVNYTAMVYRSGIGVWALYGISPTAAHTPAGVAGNSLSLNIPAGGIGIAAYTLGLGSTGAWSGLIERYDRNDTGDYITGASGEFPSAQTGLTVSDSGGASYRSFVAASWGPA
ncbi:hypothetical protein MXD81_09695, partial [Microbacteriaceae bacterium K1510]|nr:hypothetical protein [Microbacteriaceae bacterium K1510]